MYITTIINENKSHKGFHGIINSYKEKPIKENVYEIKAKQSPAAFQNNFI